MDVRKVTREYRLHQWADMLRECQESGKTIRSWCMEQGVNEKSYYYRQQKLRESACQEIEKYQRPIPDSKTAGNLPIFTEVQLPSQLSNHVTAVTIRMGEAIVEIHNGAEQTVVENTLRALKNLC